MQHKIGLDYTHVLPTRKTKKDLPLIGRLQRTVDIHRLRHDVSALLRERQQANVGSNEFDPSASEHNYHLKTSRGESFIRNYDEFYNLYSMIGFHELTDEAKAFAQRCNFSVTSLTPSSRLRGMKNTGYEKYHPYYDERNYTKPTAFCRDSIADLLGGFQAQASRSALVCLAPGKYISPHFDIGPEYITRTMVPILTNEKAFVGIRVEGGYEEFHLPADGGIYFINAGYEHYAINGGDQPRHQIRICLNGQEDLEDLQEVKSLRFISDQDFASHPCAPAPRIAGAEGSQNILKQTLNEFNLSKSGSARLE